MDLNRNVLPLELPAASALAGLLTRQRAAYAARLDPLSLEARLAALRKLEDSIYENRLRIAEAVSEDFGNRAREESLLGEVFIVLDDIRATRRHLKRWMRPRKVSVNWQFRPSRGMLLPQPLGVVGVIGAYNYPVMTTLAPAVGAMAAGNHVMMKPSSQTPRTSALMRELIAGLFPEDYVTVVTGESDVAKAFSKLPFDHLVFTGSTRVGKLIMRDAAENLVPVTLELGGKCPAIIGEDFPVEEATEAILHIKLGNAGQTCVTADYVFVHESKLQDFLAHARKTTQHFYPSLVKNPDYTRVLMRNDWLRLQDWVSEAKQGGASVEVINPANEDCNPENRAFPPTLVWNCPQDSKLRQEEVFGPVLPVVTYRHLDEVVTQVNAGERPLALYYFGHRREDIDKILRRTISGGVTLNGCGFHAIQHNLPFGGVGASGIGAYHGQAGFERFSHLKPVMRMSRLAAAVALLRPPFGTRTRWLLGTMLRNWPKLERY